MASEQLNFNGLVQQIKTIHDSLQKQAVKAVNMGLTLRNWMIGHYIYEYEQDGQDRAEYGEKLLHKLSDSLQHYGLKRVEERELRRFRLFYLTYPRIRESLTPELLPFLKNAGKQLDTAAIRETLSPESRTPGQTLLERLSFSHLAELIAIEDAQKRYFYEIECIRGNWSVRELKRQIASLYYERSGLSKNPKKLSELTLDKAQAQPPHQIIRDPYVFEFLGQLNTYVNWYARHEKTEGDNPPVGILLCTQENHALVEYALARMDNQLFVSKYQLELPDKKQMQRFLETQLAASTKLEKTIKKNLEVLGYGE